MSGAPVSAPRVAPAVEAGGKDWRRWLAFVFAGVIYLFLYSPIIVMAVFSFNDSPIQNLPLKGFSTV